MKITMVHAGGIAAVKRISGRVGSLCGLSGIAKSLLEAGFEVECIEANLMGFAMFDIVNRVRDGYPDVVMIGHSGACSADVRAVTELCGMLRRALGYPSIVLIGSEQSHAWPEVLVQCPDIEVFVPAATEKIILLLMQAIADGQDLHSVPGIAIGRKGRLMATPSVERVRSFMDCPARGCL